MELTVERQRIADQQLADVKILQKVNAAHRQGYAEIGRAHV